MRDITSIIVHCSATKPFMDIGADTIREWHVEGNGWSDIGYHWVIKRNGTIEIGREESVIGAHAKGFNSDSIGICLIGGIDNDDKSDANFTLNQYMSLMSLIDSIKNRHPIDTVIGHRDVSSKDCPCFDVQALLAD